MCFDIIVKILKTKDLKKKTKLESNQRKMAC